MSWKDLHADDEDDSPRNNNDECSIESGQLSFRDTQGERAMALSSNSALGKNKRRRRRSSDASAEGEGSLDRRSRSRDIIQPRVGSTLSSGYAVLAGY